MTRTIFLLSEDGDMKEMALATYPSEELLQRLLAEHPSVLSSVHTDDQGGQDWLLVTREAGVPDEEGGTGRWSLDHLFLDREGIPTLIEVKRSSDTRIRREVVGQMLDYAANSVAYWPIEKVQSFFADTMRERDADADPDLVLEEFVGTERSPSEFWEDVKTNLQAGKVRLVFVADEIPKELQRIIEFLNEQMDPAEVLAIEVKQYVGEGEQQRTLVPTLIGRTALAESRKRVGGSDRRTWDEESFFDKVARSLSPEDAVRVRDLYEFTVREAKNFDFGTGESGAFHGKFGHISNMYTVCVDGRILINFRYFGADTPDECYTRMRRFMEDIGAEVPDSFRSMSPSITLDEWRGWLEDFEQAALDTEAIASRGVEDAE